MRRILILLIPLLLACSSSTTQTSDVSGSREVEEESTPLPEPYNYLNEVRLAIGLDPIQANPQLEEAAQAHADFILEHCDKYGSTGLSPHMESKDFGEGFTGNDPMARALAAGYQGYGVGEVIAFVDDPIEAIDTWLNSLYHRLLILEPGAVEAGYGHGRVHRACRYRLYRRVDVMDIGIGGGGEITCYFYPYDGQEDVPVRFDGYETPQPPPPPSGYPSGFIVTLQCRGGGWHWKEVSFTDSENNPLEFVAVSNVPEATLGIQEDPYSLAGSDPYLALYSYRPLQYATTYHVVVKAERGGVIKEFSTTFDTEEEE